MDNYKISVILPVYNSAMYLGKAVESILNQTYKEFELIIIDDGSTDNSVDIIKKYTEERVKFFQSENKGCSYQRNFGLSIAQNKLIALMDSDDISQPTRFEEQINILRSHSDISIVGTNCMVMNEDGKIIGNRIYPTQKTEIDFITPIFSPVCHASIMGYKQSFIDAGGYNNNHRAAGDFDLILRLLLSGCKFYNIQKYLYIRRTHNKSISISMIAEQRDNHYLSAIKYLDENKKKNVYNYKRALIEYYYGDVNLARNFAIKSFNDQRIPKSKLIRIILISYLGNRFVRFLRNSGVTVFINKITNTIFGYDFQNIRIKSR